MLKKLKRKFIIINMLMVGIVILIVFAVVCIHTYTTEKNKVVDRLEQAIIIRENMVDYLPEIGTFGKKSNIGSEYIVSAITVQLDGDNQMFSKIEINATMSEEGLEKAVGTALAAEEDCGIISSMNIMYLRRTNARGIKIAFTDITEFQNSVKSAAVGGGLLCAAVLAVMFAVSVILSSLAIRPVKDAWTKQKQFIADASHELKTPLTVILANNNILQSHPGDSIADQKQWLESTEEEASRMKKLIDQMLFLAKSDAEQSPVRTLKNQYF